MCISWCIYIKRGDNNENANRNVRVFDKIFGINLKAKKN